MKHNNFNKFPKDYKTFAELVEYAKKRAKHSAARNGHQEFAYWIGVMEWALACDQECLEPADELPFHIEATMAKVVGVEMRSESYARAVHCRQMLVNRGEKPPRLSLDWLRKAAQNL